MPATEDPNPWIMIELDHQTTLVGIATEGETVEGDPFYTRTYTISYGINGVHFTDYMENEEVKVSGYTVPSFRPAFKALYAQRNCK